MSEGLWSLICVSVGGILTFAFTQFSSWQASKAESKRIKNRVLFFMLEIHKHLSKLSSGTSDDGKIIADYFRERFGSEKAAAVLPLEKQQEITKTRAQGRLMDAKFAMQRIEAQYPQALEALSGIDPFAAQRLIPLGDLLARMDLALQDTVVAPSDASSTEASDERLELIFEHIQQGMISDAVAIIEQVTLQLVDGAFAWRTRHRLRANFVRNKQAPARQTLVEIKELGDKFL